MEAGAMEVVIEECHINAAKLAYACDISRDKYVPGTPIDRISSSDIGWVINVLPGVAGEISTRLNTSVPLMLYGSPGHGDVYNCSDVYSDDCDFGYTSSALSYYGSGSSNGQGYGDGSYGSGSIFGSGNGYNYGDEE